MKVVVDLDTCDAHGDCVLEAPEIFELGDDDEVVNLIQPEPPEELRKSAEKAADICPVAAITIED